MHSLRSKVLAAGWPVKPALGLILFGGRHFDSGTSNPDSSAAAKTHLHADGHRDQFSLDLITLFLLDLTVLFSLSI